MSRAKSEPARRSSLCFLVLEDTEARGVILPSSGPNRAIWNPLGHFSPNSVYTGGFLGVSLMAGWRRGRVCVGSARVFSLFFAEIKKKTGNHSCFHRFWHQHQEKDWKTQLFSLMFPSKSKKKTWKHKCFHRFLHKDQENNKKHKCFHSF